MMYHPLPLLLHLWTIVMTLMIMPSELAMVRLTHVQVLSGHVSL